MSILDISKTLIYEFWYDLIKPKYQWNCIQQSCAQWSCTQNKAKLCCMDTESFIIHIKTEDFYEDIVNDVEKWFDTSNYVECRSVKNDKISLCKNKKVITLFKDELGGKIMKEFVTRRAKAWGYLMDDDTGHKKAKGRKKCVIKRRLLVENYPDCLFNDKIILKLQHRFKSDYHNVYTESIRLH